MKKLAIFVLLCATTALNSQNLAFYFELIPEAQLPHMKPDMRKGMIGLYELGTRPAQVPNLLNGVCVLDTLSDDYLSMHTSKVSTLTIKMLSVESDSCSILTVVHTVKAAGTEDSSINFFTNTWSKLDATRFFEAPTAKDFFVENDNLSFEEFSHICIPLLLSYSFHADTLSAQLDPEKYLSKEDYKKISPALRKEPVTYSWDGTRYRRK